MIDRSTKIILALIAAGLWANALAPIMKSTPAKANDSYSRPLSARPRPHTSPGHLRCHDSARDSIPYDHQARNGSEAKFL
jgi:hypothetical protein